MAAALRVGRTLVLVAMLGAALTGLLVALLQGPGEVLPAISSFGEGVAGSPTAIGATVRTLTPVLLVGVAASIAFRAGLFDVGQIGQFLFGGLAAGAVAPFVPGPGPVIIAASVVAGSLAGSIWSVLIARLAAFSRLQLVVLSLLANYMAAALAAFLTRTLLQDPTYSVTATRPVPESAWLPVLVPRTALHGGIFAALVVLALAWLIVTRTAVGHRLTMFGRNPLAATVSGVDAPRFRVKVLAGTGAICGLAGAIEVLGVYHGYQEGTLAGTGSLAWTGLTAAILAPSGLLALLPVSALLAALSTGFAGIQRELGISSGFSTLLSGVVIVTAAFAVRSPVAGVRSRRRRRPRPEESSSPAATGPRGGPGILRAAVAKGERR